MNNHTFPRMHISLYVTDLEKSITFYNALFKKEPDKIKSRYCKYVLEKPSLIISFIERPDAVQSSFGHLGFQLETLEDYKSFKTDAENIGLIDRLEENVSCCYAKLDKFWAVDPDGYNWEIYYFHEDVEFNDPNYSWMEKKQNGPCALGEKKITRSTSNSKEPFMKIVETNGCC